MSDELLSYEPATGALLWRHAIGDADSEVAAARESWAEWAAKPVTFRIETLRRYANVVRARTEAFTDLIARETGKPLWEARTEVDSVIAKVDISAGAFAERTGQRQLDSPMGSRMALRHKPHGVLAVLGPYNFPAHLPNGHIVPALIAGNAIVFKPSEKTPATGAFMVDCLHEAGVPQGCARLLIGGPAEGKALAGHPGIDGLLFTGSARTGIALNRQFADRPEKILALEMGGNNPIIVWDTPDLYAAAIVIIQSAFTTAGQRCTAARRLIVDEALYEPLMAELLKLTSRLIVGDPHADPQPFMGPVIDNEVADLLTESFLELMMRGGRPLRHMSALWPVGQPDQPDARPLQPLLGQRPRRHRQLEPPDQRREFVGAIRRRRLERQPSAECILCGGLLRLSGCVERSGPGAGIDLGGVAGGVIGRIELSASSKVSL
jgi:succinylglutamic semialdehyde dehydrogenase